MQRPHDDEPRRATVPGSERHSLPLESLSATYRIDVALPLREREQGVPVVYLLDGDAAFPGGATMLRMMLGDGIVPPMLVVGISPPGDLRERFATRTRNFEPGDGADAFLRALTEEIVPFVEARYAVDPGQRVLFGHSGGGLFSTYAFFRAPGAFTGYIAGSPSLWRLGSRLYRYQETLEGSAPPRGKLFLAIGELEQPPGNERGALFQNVDRLAWFMRALEARGYPDVELRHRVFAGDTHTTVAGPALAHGVWWMLGRNLEEASRFWAPIPDAMRALLEDARIPTD